MERRIKMSILWFTILGALCGAAISLVASYYLDFLVQSYTTEVTLTYIDWVFVCAPAFATFGALFNCLAGFFFYKEEPKKKFLWFLRK